VVYVLSNRGYGGTEVHLRLLVLGLDREEFEPVVLLGANEPMEVLAGELRQAGITVGSLPTATRRVDVRAFVDLVRVIRDQHADIVHVLMTGPVRGLTPFLASRLAGVPAIVSTEHSHAHHLEGTPGVRGALLRAIARLRLRLATRVITVSSAQGASFRTVLRVSQKRTTVIWNGIDPNRYSRTYDGEAVCRELAVPSSAPIVGMVTSYVDYERAEDFVRAAAIVRETAPTAHFWIIGDQHPTVVKPDAMALRSMLEDLGHELGLTHQLHFLGYRDDMPRVMAALDVFVLPARYKSFGLVLLEAMATEVPVVATSTGGPAEIVRDRETGLLVPPLDPHALATATATLLMDKEAAARMGRQGRRRVEQTFTAAEMVGRTADLYRCLVLHRHSALSPVPGRRSRR
jgi:glycosyltransferase involved in cell wall biosynthesis